MTKKNESIDDVVGEARKANERAQQLAASLKERRDALDAERVALVNRSAHVARLPLRREDAKEALLMSIDHMARGFKTRVNWSNTFSLFAWPQRGYAPENMQTSPSRRARPMCLEDVYAAERNGCDSVFSLKGATLLTSDLDGGTPKADALCFFFGEGIKRKIEEQFDELFPDYRARSPKGRGLPQDWAWQEASADELETSASQRRAEISANAELIKALDKQIAEIDEDLARLGAASRIE